MRTVLRVAALFQGSYFLVTGLWPFVHMRSFLAVTGPKTDLWLVKAVAALVAAIGAAVLSAGARKACSLEIMLVAGLSALGLAGIDGYYVAHGTISPVYLADACLEVPLGLLWMAAISKRRASLERID